MFSSVGISREDASSHAKMRYNYVMAEVPAKAELQENGKLFSTFEQDIAALEQRFEQGCDRLERRLTLKMGGITAASVAIAAVVVKLL